MKLYGLDETDIRILELLTENARLSYSELGERVGLSRVAAKNRVLTLEKRGIITGYHASVDPLSIPEMQIYVTFIQTTPGEYDAICERLKEEQTVTALCQTAGECCLYAVCMAQSIEQMRDFAKRMRQENQGLLRFSAYTVLDIVKGGLLPGTIKEHANEYKTSSK